MFELQPEWAPSRELCNTEVIKHSLRWTIPRVFADNPRAKALIEHFAHDFAEMCLPHIAEFPDRANFGPERVSVDLCNYVHSYNHVNQTHVKPVYRGSKRPNVETLPLRPPASPLVAPGMAVLGQPTSYHGTPRHLSFNCHTPSPLSRPSRTSSSTPTRLSHIKSTPTTEHPHSTPCRIPTSPHHSQPESDSSNPSLQPPACDMNMRATPASSVDSGSVSSPSKTSTAYSGGEIEEWDEDLEDLVHVMSSEMRVEPASHRSRGANLHIHIYPDYPSSPAF